MLLLVPLFLAGALALSSSPPCTSLDGPFCTGINGRAAPARTTVLARDAAEETPDEAKTADKIIKLVKAIMK